MRRSSILIVIVLIILSTIIFIHINRTQSSSQSYLNMLSRENVIIYNKDNQSHNIYAWEALTPSEQERGLMYVTSMEDNQGMIFKFPTSYIQTFWMKNTLIPLDIVFLQNGRIVNISQNTPPCKISECPVYSSTAPSNSVLELNAGYTKNNNIQPGDKVIF